MALHVVLLQRLLPSGSINLSNSALIVAGAAVP